MREREYPDPRPRDDTDVVKDIARELADIAAQIATFKGEANAYLGDPNYGTLRLRLENAHAAVEGHRGGAEEGEAQREPLGPLQSASARSGRIALGTRQREP